MACRGQEHPRGRRLKTTPPPPPSDATRSTLRGRRLKLPSARESPSQRTDRSPPVLCFPSPVPIFPNTGQGDAADGPEKTDAGSRGLQRRGVAGARRRRG